MAGNGAVIVDIREADERRRERIDGAVNCPVSAIDRIAIEGETLIFHCRSGGRTETHRSRLAERAGGRPWHVLDGGIEGWKQAGLPVIVDRRQPIDMQRQVMIAAGGLVLAGVALAIFIWPPLIAIPAFVGAGLVVAGVTGFCGMARLLKLAPWNRV